MNKVFVVVAGGSGKRMKNDVPKQFIIINNFPILYYTLKNIHTACPEAKIILVLPLIHIDFWKQLCVNYNINIEHTIVEGGPERFHSVKNGLNAINDFNQDTIVAIHDGVRPFVSKDIIDSGFLVASRKGSAVPAISIPDTLREVSGAYSKIVPRQKYCLIQTPQFFNFKQLIDAYQITWSDTFTDDAVVYETSGRQITLIEGSKNNFKITEISDIIFAKAIIDNG